jgi:hypothetical protein
MDPRRRIGSDEGFALTYVLMVITLLGIVAYSVIMLQNVRRLIAVKEIAHSKARYAAQSIIAEYASGQRQEFGSTMGQYSVGRRQYGDESEAQLKVYPWGLYLLAVAKGSAGRACEYQTAVLAAVPDSSFQKAIFYGNNEHDLILAGTTRIIGDVSLRRGSATLGTLPDFKTPRILPVSGRVKVEPMAKFPMADKTMIQESVAALNSILEGSEESMGTFLKVPASSTEAQESPDTVRWQGVAGSLVLDKTLKSGTHPLYIAVDGEILIEQGTRISGPVALLASGKITVSEGALIHNALLFSRKEIVYLNHAECSCQLLAPKIHLKDGAFLRYPSSVVGLPLKSNGAKGREIMLGSGSRVEGFVGILSMEGGSQEDPPVVIEPRAAVWGAVYSDRTMTLDGDVTGTVLTRDFQFTHPPTRYNGWIKSGTIDRSRLPKGFLVPVMLGGANGMGVLEWL